MKTDQAKNFTQTRNSKILLGFFFFTIALSISISFYKFFVLREYTIQAQTECDPNTEVCFVYHCDSTAETCSGDPEQDTSYYKLIERDAKNIPLCDPKAEGCTPLVCPDGEVGCAITFCDANVEGAECTNPEEYRLQHPNDTENKGDETANPDIPEKNPNVVPAE